MRLSSYGVFCISSQIIFVVGVAIYSFTNTTYVFSWYTEDVGPDAANIPLLKGDFFPLMGVLCAGFYLHGLGLPIL